MLVMHSEWHVCSYPSYYVKLYKYHIICCYPSYYVILYIYHIIYSYPSYYAGNLAIMKLVLLAS